MIHDKAAGVVSFVVGFAWKANARAGLGLQWRYQERTWSGWGVPEQSPGSAALRQLLSSVPVDAPEGTFLAIPSFALLLIVPSSPRGGLGRVLLSSRTAGGCDRSAGEAVPGSPLGHGRPGRVT